MIRRYRYLLLGLVLLLAGALFWYWRGLDIQAGRPGILYLAWDEAGLVQLFLAADEGREARQLTGAVAGVRAYRPAPNGRQIAYSAGRNDGGADIWLANVDGSDERLVLACPGALCDGPVWRRDGRLLLYERRPLQGEDGSPGPPRLHWLDPAGGETEPLFAEEEASGHLAAFSADGRWLAYIAPLQQQLRVVNVESNQIVTIANELGQRPLWHPHLPALLFTDVRLFQGEQFVNHIYRADLPAEDTLPAQGDLPEEAVANLSGQVAFEDSSPSWSPDGSRVVFGRKLPRTPTGGQLWLMDGDGSNQRPLTDAGRLQFSRPRWSPAGDEVLVQQFDIEAPGGTPGIWLLDLESGALQEVAIPAFQASWLP